MNPLRTLLVHVDSTSHSMRRLTLAHGLARQLDAHLTALYAVLPWLLLYPSPLENIAVMGSAISELDHERLVRARKAFSIASLTSPTVQWAELAHEPPDALVRRALYADLLILGQDSDEAEVRHDVPGDFAASTILHSGRPAIVVPREGPLAPDVRSVVLAWNASPQAARALTAALPLTTLAREVHVVICSKPDGASPDGGEDIAHYLRQHGVHPVVHCQKSSSSDVGRHLLSMATELNGDLLVMGCYGHARAREWVLGGTTRTVLDTMLLPVLMAH